MNLAFTEVVNEENIKELKCLVEIGPTKYSGAKMIRRPDGRCINLRYSSNRTEYILKMIIL